MRTTGTEVTANNINRFDVIRLSGLLFSQQNSKAHCVKKPVSLLQKQRVIEKYKGVMVLIKPHNCDGNIEIMYQGRPYLFKSSERVVLIKKASN